MASLINNEINDDILDLLTAYALGVLEPNEIAQVSVLLEARPELRATVAELRAAADTLPYALTLAEPPADLRQRVLDRATGRAPRVAAPKPVGFAQRARFWMTALGALAAVALLAAVLGWSQYFRSGSELASMQNTVVAQKANIDNLQTNIDTLQAQVAAAQRVLTSMNGSGGTGAILETQTGQTVFVAQLPRLQPGRVYQLWRIQGNNPPASAGLFTANQQGYIQSDLTGDQQPQAGETIAVTDEPDGGSAGPTTQPLIVGTSNA